MLNDILEWPNQSLDLNMYEDKYNSHAWNPPIVVDLILAFYCINSSIHVLWKFNINNRFDVVAQPYKFRTLTCFNAQYYIVCYWELHLMFMVIFSFWKEKKPKKIK